MRMGGQTRLRVSFRNFTNAPKNQALSTKITDVNIIHDTKPISLSMAYNYTERR